MIKPAIISASTARRGVMDRRERRHQRFLMLLAEAENSNKLLAELVGKSPGQIGQIKNSKGHFGNDVASQLEQRMGKPEGWMDQWTTGEGGWDQPARSSGWHLVRLLDELPDGVRKSIADTIVESHKAARKAGKKKNSSR